METQQTAFRLPRELVKRLDAHVAELRRRQPGMTISRADAVRMLLSRALAAEEAMTKRQRDRKGFP